MNFKQLTASVLIAASLFSSPVLAGEEAMDALQEYMEFSEYESGIILPQQITEDVFKNVVFIDTRTAEQFEAGTIPGAINIEWRDVLGRIDEIPTDKKVIMFCNTGTLSSFATFALRAVGRENVVVLQTGRDGWLKDAAYKP